MPGLRTGTGMRSYGRLASSDRPHTRPITERGTIVTKKHYIRLYPQEGK